MRECGQGGERGAAHLGRGIGDGQPGQDGSDRRVGRRSDQLLHNADAQGRGWFLHQQGQQGRRVSCGGPVDGGPALRRSVGERR